MQKGQNHAVGYIVCNRYAVGMQYAVGKRYAVGAKMVNSHSLLRKYRWGDCYL